MNVKVDLNATDAHRFAVLFSRGSHNQSSAIRGNPGSAAAALCGYSRCG